MAKKISPRLPKEWQKDSMRVTSPKVQLWANGVMRGLISLEAARYNVYYGHHFVISDQAIGELNDNGTMNS